MYDYFQNKYQPRYGLWQDFSKFSSLSLTTSRKEWLLDKGSLTTRLVKASNNDFMVNVLAQQWGYAQTSEYRLLNIQHRRLCLIREVLLMCKGKPWVYARSVMPCSSLTGKLRHLRQFGSQPLGQLLFNTASMSRSPFQLCKTTNAFWQNPYLEIEHIDPNINIWGRRSCFKLFDKPLIVSEFFLPDFEP